MGPGLFLALAGLVAGLGLVVLLRRLRPVRGDALALAVLVPLALLSVRPYVGHQLVGSGDAQHYALQVADFVAQARAGVLPVLVGQSESAFNGGIHTLRTAPYFTHFAGLLDLLTARRLDAVALQNLAVAATAVLAAWAAYASALLLSGRRRVPAALLAGIYVLSPAVVGPLALGDMVATFMAAPWVALTWAGIVESLRPGGHRAALPLGTGALALAWYAHSPIGAWLTLAWGAALAGTVLREGGRPAGWVRPAAALLLFAGLTAWVAASIATLGPRPFGAPPAGAPAFSGPALLASLRSGFTPFVAGDPAAGIQLGAAFWTVAALLAVGAARRAAGPVSALLLVPFLPLLFPLPVISDALWRLVPDALVEQTTWPAQRLCPLLAGGLLAAGAAALRGVGPVGTRRLTVLLAAGLAWSAAESVAFHARPGVASLGPEVHRPLLAPENLRLTRYSYAFLPRLPGTFSHGWMDPEWESRLLDAEQRPVTDNARATVAAAPPTAFRPIAREVHFLLPGPGAHVLEFAFAAPDAAGEVVVAGPGFLRPYTLPASGEPLAFGSGPAAARTIPVRLASPGEQRITVSSSVPGTSVRVLPMPAELPVRVTGLIPYRATATAPAAGFLETPRMHLPGYAATVDGRTVDVRRSPEGLVMVPVPAGRSTVEVTYPGPPVLRAAWFLSLGVFAAWPWLLVRGLTRGPAARPPRSLASALRDGWRAGRVRFVATALVISAVLGGGVWFGQKVRADGADGPLRLVVEFPLSPAARAEPLLTLGRTGAADCLYVVYEDSDHIRLGFDHWGVGGPVSAPLPLRRGRPQVVEIDVGGLRTARRPDGAAKAPLRVTLDGAPVFDLAHPFHPAAASEIFLGANPAGLSTAAPRFSGRILEAERIPAVR